MNKNSSLIYFAKDYQEARGKFLSAAGTTFAKIENYLNPVDQKQAKELYTDVALIGSPDADKFIVLISATHGVEGFAGSAIQVGLLRDGIDKQLRVDTAILMIHAINPYGMSHIRRTNEDNVDLNRNFYDFSIPLPSNPGYAELADAITPKTRSSWSEFQCWSRLLWYGLTNGFGALVSAISSGQFSHPEGLFYGGKEETWSNKTLKLVLRKWVANAKTVVVIDFHTGLGPKGVAEIIMNDPRDSTNFKRATKIWGEQVRSTVAGDSVSAHLHSSLKLGIKSVLPDVEITAVSMEFGTAPTIKTFRALRAENWSYHYGIRNSSASDSIKQKLIEVFYPDHEAWKKMVLNRGNNALDQVLKWLVDVH
jgi:hypothetical protein